MVNKGQLNQFKVLGNGERFGVNNYIEQKHPKGLPDLLLGEKFIGKDNVALILGDNFYGQSLTKKLKHCIKLKSGCKILVHQ